MTDTWHIDDCPKPDGWEHMDQAQRDQWWLAIKSVAAIEKVEPSVVATRPCHWDWSVYNNERANHG